MRGTRDDIADLLKDSRRAIAEVLAGQPSQFGRWWLPQLSREIERELADFGRKGGERIVGPQLRAAIRAAIAA
ncbi:MAG: hypothetical protein AABM33_14075 [Pseudomonadota bacterium]